MGWHGLFSLARRAESRAVVSQPVKSEIGAASRIVGAEPPHAITYVAAALVGTVAVAVIVTGAVGVSAGVRSRWHIRWAKNLLVRTAVAPLAITAGPHPRQGRRSDNHHDCRAEKQFLHDALPWPRPRIVSRYKHGAASVPTGFVSDRCAHASWCFRVKR